MRVKEETSYKRFYYAVFGVTAVLIAGLFAAHFIFFSGNLPGYGRFEALVTFVTDGDTLVIDTGKTVRLLGIDTPELHHPDRPAERYGLEAKEALAGMVSGKKCVFRYDEKRKYDVYGRVLAHVFTSEGLHVNLTMVKNGFAYYYEKSEDPLSRALKEHEEIAKKRKAGVWADAGN